MRLRRNLRSRWVWLSDEAVRDEPSPSISRGRTFWQAGIDLCVPAPLPTTSAQADRVARRLLKRRTVGVILHLHLGDSSSPSRRQMVADLLDAIVARQPQLAIVVALVDPVLPADAPVLLGGVCADWEQGVHRVLEQAAQQTLKRVEGDDELAPGDRLLELPSVIRDRVPAWTEAVESTMARGAGFRVAGLHVSDRSLTPEAIETTLRQLLPCADDRRRQSWSPWLKGAGMALMVLVLVAMAAGIWWTVDETGVA